MYIAHRWRDRNLTRMELVVALLIMSILIGVSGKYMLKIFSRIEQRMIESTIMNINNVLAIRASFMMMKGDSNNLNLLENINPFEDLQASEKMEKPEIMLNDISTLYSVTSIVAPSNYGGVINSYDQGNLEKGKWYFNQDSHFILYIVRNSEYFTTDINGYPMIRYQIVMEYKDNNANDRYDPNIDDFHTIRIQTVDDYQWSY